MILILNKNKKKEKKEKKQKEIKHTKPCIKFSFKKASLLKGIFESIKDLIGVGVFECNQEGIVLSCLDSSHVSLVNLHLKAESLPYYQCDRNTTLGIKMESISKILKIIDNDAHLTLMSECESDTISITSKDREKKKASQFELKLMDIDVEPMGIPDQKYHTDVKMLSSEFQKLCRDFMVIGEEIIIKTTNTDDSARIEFSINGDIGTGILVFQENGSEKDYLSLEIEKEVDIKFSLRHLNAFTKASSLSNMVTLSLHQELPLRVEYKMEIGTLRFYLASKIEEEKN